MTFRYEIDQKVKFWDSYGEVGVGTIVSRYYRRNWYGKRTIPCYLIQYSARRWWAYRGVVSYGNSAIFAEEFREHSILSVV